MPWRETRNPYHIWISEIILQQTRVEQGREFYLRFIDEFPKILDLATASEEAVLKAWQGLGYYSRARNLHKAAQQIVQEMGGEFPHDYDQIRSLPGIGDYTAAAIASFAYSQPKAALDGNVKRWSSRFFGIQTELSKPAFSKEVLPLLQVGIENSGDPYSFNQASIELGSQICTPQSPRCESCPLQTDCYAYTHGRVSEFPKVTPKKAPQIWNLHFLALRWKNEWCIMQRPAKGIWASLYEFPSLSCDTPEQSLPDAWAEALSSSIKVLEHRQSTHLLSHKKVQAQCWYAEWIDPVISPLDLQKEGRFLQNMSDSNNSEVWISLSELRRVPVHRLMDSFIDALPA